jgi:acetyltransferase-like isoleucine patch superfamily enzyme
VSLADRRRLARLSHAVDGSRAERRKVEAMTNAGGGWWRQPMRLPARSDSHRPSRQISVGRDVFIGAHSWINLTSPDARLVVGDGVVIGNSFTVACGVHVTIGNGVMMSDRVTILDQLHDFRRWVGEAIAEGREPICTWDLTEAEPVVIGAGTWLGIGVVVLPGVTIGQGCAVGANAVVTKDLPDFSVAVGVPARVIGSALGDERPEDVHQL